MDLFQKCYNFAENKHKGQSRKGSGLPYVIHPLKVCEKLHQWQIPIENYESMYCIAILHDVLEDTDTTLIELIEGFGEEIASGVRNLTFIYDANYSMSKSKQKEKYLQSLADSSINQVLVVKIADRLSNVEDFISGSDPYAEKYYHKGTTLYTEFNRRMKDKALRGIFSPRTIGKIQYNIVTLGAESNYI